MWRLLKARRMQLIHQIVNMVRSCVREREENDRILKSENADNYEFITMPVMQKI